jgi:hypothetical protein
VVRHDIKEEPLIMKSSISLKTAILGFAALLANVACSGDNTSQSIRKLRLDAPSFNAQRHTVALSWETAQPMNVLWIDATRGNQIGGWVMRCPKEKRNCIPSGIEFGAVAKNGEGWTMSRLNSLGSGDMREAEFLYDDVASDPEAGIPVHFDVHGQREPDDQVITDTVSGEFDATGVISATRRYVADAMAAPLEQSFAEGTPIRVENARGDVSVVGVPGLRAVRLSARPKVWMDVDQCAEARAALEEVRATLKLEVGADGAIAATCGRANGDTRDSLIGEDKSSGCQDFVVEVPGDIGIALAATATDNSLSVRGVTAAANAALTLNAGYSIDAWDLTGSVDATSEYEISVAVTPTKGSTIDINKGLEPVGDVLPLPRWEREPLVILKLPIDFAADIITLKSPDVKIDASTFPNVLSGRGRGTPGTGASRISVASKERIYLSRK